MAKGASSLELRGSAGQVAEVRDRHPVQSVGAVRQLLGQKVIAAGRSPRSFLGEMVELCEAVGTGVDETMVDPHVVHPVDPFGHRRIVPRVENDRASVLLGPADQAREQFMPIRPAFNGQRP